MFQHAHKKLVAIALGFRYVDAALRSQRPYLLRLVQQRPLIERFRRASSYFLG